MRKAISFFPVLLLAAFLAACGAAGNLLLSGPRCEAAELLEVVTVDVPLDAGIPLMPGTHFTKAWKVENTGTCAWGEGYALAFSTGDRLGSPDSTALPRTVSPGESLTIPLPLKTPGEPGAYQGEWLLRNDAGETFGMGENDNPLTADVEVWQLPTNVAYDFSLVHCLAQWHSGLAIFLPCQGGEENRIGFVRVLEDPELEDTRRDNPPVLNLKPDNQDNGFIQGIYPALTLQEGDRFKAAVGCMYDYQGCSVNFQLSYEQPDGIRQVLGQWSEVYDGENTQIDLDLSALAGETVSLILEVHVNGGRTAQAQAYWLNPRIERTP